MRGEALGLRMLARAPAGLRHAIDDQGIRERRNAVARANGAGRITAPQGCRRLKAFRRDC
eukprot:scaffold26361_cov54-Phaeocystis_antarctica.AAC.1